MATTHYSELKVYALSTPGVENACCEFDLETLRPTYHLLIGIPGKSNAFAIAGKLGLPDYIIEEARTHLTEQDESFEDLLTDLETSKRTIQKEQEEIAAYRRELERLKAETKEKQEKLEAQRERILREANEKGPLHSCGRERDGRRDHAQFPQVWQGKHFRGGDGEGAGTSPQEDGRRPFRHEDGAPKATQAA